MNHPLLRLNALVAIVVLTVTHTHAGLENPGPVTCPGAVDPSCKAFSFLEIVVTDGSCKGRASADCKTVSESQDGFKKSFEEWFSDEMCDSGVVESTATAVATAVAKVWSDAAIKVECEGTGGFACGWSISNGQTFALGFAEALAQAAADAGALTAVEGFCFADIRALTPVFAEAAGQAQVQACFNGTTVEDFDKSYVEVVREGVATALARASASKCNEEGQTDGLSKCTGDGISSLEETIAKEGDVCGGVSTIQPCAGPGETMCCDPEFSRSLCTCQDCGGPWVRRSKKNALRTTFMKRTGDICYCKSASDQGPRILGEQPEEGADAVVGLGTPRGNPLNRSALFESVNDLEEVVDNDFKTAVAAVAPTEIPVLEQSVALPDDAQSALGDGFKKNCLGARDTSCRAFSFLEILVTSGRCTGSASADCRTVRESQNDFKKSFDDWFADEGVCDEGKAEATSTAIAKAIAKVWSNAAVKVNCDGTGFACGWSVANGETWALGFAEALAQAAADAGGEMEGDAEGFCYADLRSVTTVIARAAGNAQAEVCTTGGEQEDFENSYVAAVQVGVATALAKATAQSCSNDGELIASSECVGNADEGNDSDISNAGDTCAGVAQVLPCAGSGMEMCCAPDFNRTLCTCNQLECTNGPWVRKSSYDKEAGTLRTFEDRGGNVCFCLKGKEGI